MMQSLLNSVATLTLLLAMVVFGDAYVINGFVRFRCDDNYYNYHGVSSNVTYIIALSNVGSFFAGALLVIAWFNLMQEAFKSSCGSQRAKGGTKDAKAAKRRGQAG